MAIIDIGYSTDSATGQMIFDSNGVPVQDTSSGINAGANTSADLLARVQNEVLGSPTQTDCENAILDAIHMWDSQTFWYNKFRLFGVNGTLPELESIAGQEFYSQGAVPSIISMPHISKALVVAFANRYPLINRTFQWVDDQSISTSWQGLPTDWAVQGGAMRIFPVPNGSYQLILDATIRFPDPQFGSDFSPWTNRGERLIRQTAKMLLFRDIIRDEEQAVVCQREVYGDPTQPRKIGEFGRLKKESVRRSGGPGKLRPSRGYMS